MDDFLVSPLPATRTNASDLLRSKWVVTAKSQLALYAVASCDVVSTVTLARAIVLIDLYN